MRSSAFGVALCSALAALPASAQAGTVSSGVTGPAFVAVGGETNVVLVSYVGGVFTIEDQGAALAAGSGCEQRTTHIATCASDAERIDLTLRDGNDTARITGTACRCAGEGGNDRLTGAQGADRLNGGKGEDLLNGSLGPDELIGGSEVDTVVYDSLSGQARSTGVGVTVDDQANDGSAQDGPAGARDNVNTDVENLTGTVFDDTLTGDADANRVRGGGGNDRLDGGFGPDALNGDAGTDRVVYSSRTAGVLVDIDGSPNDGNADDGPPGARDNVNTTVEDISGGAGADTLLGSTAPNRIYGANSPDNLAGRDGDDELDGGRGPDELSGGAGTDTATYAMRGAPVTASIDDLPNDGNDEDGGVRDNVRADIENLIGGKADDSLAGDDNANRLAGEAGADTLEGLGGDDTLLGGVGADETRGGGGVDTASYEDHPGAVTATIDGQPTSGNATDGGADLIDTDIENLAGGPEDDTLAGDDGANRLLGGGGYDTLDGRSGPDVLDGQADGGRATWAGRGSSVTVTLDGQANDGNPQDGPANARDNALVDDVVGGDGNDTLIGNESANTFVGGPGADSLRGGHGVDRASYSERTEAVIATLDDLPNDGNAEDGPAGARDDLRVESVDGGNGDDELTGNNGFNELNGLEGDDLLIGEGSVDSLSGSTGDDALLGGDGPDLLHGGDGADELTGGIHNDTLVGDAGPDTLRGGDHDDFLLADDSEVDSEIDCGDDEPDRAIVDLDPMDPPAIDCEFVSFN